MASPSTTPLSAYATDAARWQAVSSRNSGADGAFCFAVKTVGVFCRPSCPSTRPKRVNVEYFDTPTQAGEAGYRPCKRCRPLETVPGYAETRLPARNGAETIRYAFALSSLGSVLVATSARGICAISLGDDIDLMLSALQTDFGDATLAAGGSELDALARDVVRLVETPRSDHGLVLDIRGTDFQLAVWSVLDTLSPGETVSYADIAARLDRPEAVRAVARACGANRLAVIIPCHRVVRKSGDVSGYRWGVERKKTLLAREAAA